MPLFDLPLHQLEKYKSPEPEPEDFDKFWADSLSESERFPVDARFHRLDNSIYKMVDAYDVTFGGYLGQPVKGWYLEPAGNTQKLPCLVGYLGYGSGRSLPLDHLLPPVCGFAYFLMDTRGQGSVNLHGDTPDDAGSGPQVPGFLTKGIQSKESYYYRRVFVDAARAVQMIANHDHVDPERIGVTGGSQGGAISIAAAALCADRVKVLMADVPFLCDFRRATTMFDSMPYQEVSNFLKCHRDKVDQVYNTLSYFDCVNIAKRVKATTLFSVGLMDNICPPSTIYAAYNEITSAIKEIRHYEFNAHEGGGPFQAQQRMEFAQKHL